MDSSTDEYASLPLRWLLSFFILFVGGNLSAARADEGSKVVLDLLPTKENPRNSEGAFITLKSGRILFFYTQFSGGARDESPAKIVSIYSDNEGVSWSGEPEVVVGNDGGMNVMSVSLLRLKSGKIALFYLLKNSMHDCHPLVRFSADEAKTWSGPKVVFDAPGYFVLNNDRVIQTSTGRLVMPVAFHRAKDGNAKSQRTFDHRAIVIWYLSDDEGQTWQEAKDWWAIPVSSSSGMQEPGVVELAEGELFSWARTDTGMQYGCVSKDNGSTWSSPTPTTLKSPVSPASIKRLPNSTDFLAIYNDHSGDFPFPKGKRTPLTAAISSDGGKTWPVKKLLEDDPKGWFCYTAIHYANDSVLLGYSAGSSLSQLRIRRVTMDWLRGK